MDTVGAEPDRQALIPRNQENQTPLPAELPQRVAEGDAPGPAGVAQDHGASNG